MQFGEALRQNHTIRTLDIAKNNIGKAGAISIAKAVSNHPSLVYLDLGFNEIGEEGAFALATSFAANTMLSELSLSKAIKELRTI